MKFLAVVGLAVVAVNGLRDRNYAEHDIYMPSSTSEECCLENNMILCGTRIKDCCNAKKCDVKNYWFTTAEWCPKGTQVDDSKLKCNSCSGACTAKGLKVCSTGLISGITGHEQALPSGSNNNNNPTAQPVSGLQCCAETDCTGTITHECAPGTAVDLGKCVADSTWTLLKGKIGF